MMTRIALCSLVLVLPLAYAPPAIAIPDGYLACRDAASSARSMRACDTHRAEVETCQERRSGGGVNGPVRCMEQRLQDWLSALEAEEAALAEAGKQQGDWDDWIEKRDRICRNEEQIRLSAERVDEAYAAFEVLRCELRHTIRRTLKNASIIKGFRK